MDREKARIKLRECLEFYLIDKGINPKRPFICFNPDHDDHNPSMSFDRLRNRVHCFSCGVSYDVIDLIALDRNCTISEAFRFGYKLFGINVDLDNIDFLKDKQDKTFSFSGQRDSFKVLEDNFDRNKEIEGFHKNDEVFSDYFLECSKRILSVDYLKSVRGLSDEVVFRFHLGYDPNFVWGTGGRSWRAIIIPTGDGRSSFTARNIDVNAVGMRKHYSAGILFLLLRER